MSARAVRTITDKQEILRTIFHLVCTDMPSDAAQIPKLSGLQKMLSKAGKLGTGAGQVELIPALHGADAGMYLLQYAPATS